MNRGLYIVIEGIVGSGKGTQSVLLHDALKEMYPDRDIVSTFEPGGSEIANSIRMLVQATEFDEPMSPWCDAYLYAASRAQTLSTIVKPEVEKGSIVISDRSFISSLVIQGYTQGVGIDTVLHINQPLFDIISPDVIIYLDIDPEVGLSRTYDVTGDKFEKESIAFYTKVRDGYNRVSRQSIFKDIWFTIEVKDREPHDIHTEILSVISSSVITT